MAKEPPPAAPPRTFGPVEDPADYVRPDWWRALFGSTYLLTDADVLDDPVTRQEVERFIALLGLSPDARVLDVCCGQGRHVLELARRGFTAVEGLDRSRYLIRKARETARREGLQVPFREGDSRKLPYAAASFDAVMLLGNSFGYFEAPQDDLRVLREALRVLKPGGRFLLDLVSGDYLRQHFQARSWEWLDAQRFVCRERTLADGGRRLITREVVTHTEKGVLVDQFYAERLYGRDDLEALLAEAGFAEIRVEGMHEPASARNQDLGMMGHRLVLTARAAKDRPALPKAARRPERHVVVVMGDPRLADEVKVGAVFDEDDFYTIDLLKKALASLDGYRFTYLDDHASLPDDLRRLRGETDLVLNLCDEGYENDPRKELHVPALLEMVGLPYTGAGPQCLAFCYDKSLVRGVAREMSVPVAEARFLRPGDAGLDLSTLRFPVIVKPNTGDSSIGVTQKSVAYDAEELAEALVSARAIVGSERALLVEEFLTGKEITVGIIGNASAGYEVMPITEDDYSELPPELPRICGYEAKWLPDSPYMQKIKSVPVALPEEVRRFVEMCSLRLFERLGCRDYARFDWRFGADGQPRLLEANPNPGWCWDGHLVKQAAYAGYDYADVLRMILEAAFRRLAPEPVTVPVGSNGV